MSTAERLNIILISGGASSRWNNWNKCKYHQPNYLNAGGIEKG